MGYNLTQINPAYELVSDVIVGTATTTVDFTGLSFDKTDDLMLVSDIVTTSSSGQVSIYFNGNTTATNYYVQELYVDGTTIASYRGNTTTLTVTLSNSKDLVLSKIKLTNNGYVICQSSINRGYSTTTPKNLYEYQTSTFTSTSVTSIIVSGYIGAGSRFQLYKRKAPIIADVIVSTATTSVDFTGLTFDKGSEYMLVSNFITNNASKILVNGNITETNYYRQSLYAVNSIIGASRGNDAYIYDFGGNNLVYTSIKLTNNGYVELQNNTTTNIGSGTVILDTVINSSVFTATSITSLRIESSGANGIGVGSRFQLIKLK